MSSPRTRKRTGCPLCGNATSAAYAPFCGRGCRDRDLLAWFGEGYRLPGRTIDDAEEEAARDGLDSASRTPL